jgi:hypothetical protein
MSDLESLIERLAALSGPDRRLDAEIACAIKFPHLRPAEPDDHKEHQRGYLPSAGNIWCPTGFLMADSYTSSIDAALTLVPEGLGIALDTRPHSQVTKLGSEALAWCSEDRDVPSVAVLGRTPAIALCIAALRARAQADEAERCES